MLTTWLVLASSLALFFFMQLGWALVQARKRRRDALVRQRLEMARQQDDDAANAALLPQDSFIRKRNENFK